MNKEQAIKMLRHCEAESHCYDGIHGNCKRCNKRIAFDMAIEALKREDHDGCDGCRYEANDELSFPCAECKQNYVDKYVPMPEHDREWIIGCIKHDGFIKTDRGDKANQIILDALSADNTSTNTSTKSTNTPTNTSTKSTNISTDASADRPRGEWIHTPNDRDFVWWTCSECGHKIFSETEKDRIEFHAYCGRCGAYMRGGEDK